MTHFEWLSGLSVEEMAIFVCQRDWNDGCHSCYNQGHPKCQDYLITRINYVRSNPKGRSSIDALAEMLFGKFVADNDDDDMKITLTQVKDYLKSDYTEVSNTLKSYRT